MKPFASLAVLLVCASTSFARQGAQDFVGAWESPEIRATFEADPQMPGGLRGRFVKGANTFDFTAIAQGSEARGAFEAGGQKFDFDAMLQAGQLMFKTGSSTYALKRVGPSAPQMPKKRNPLEDTDAPPAPDPAPGPSPTPSPTPSPSAAPGVIGVQLWTNDDGFIEVRALMPDGPAEKAGIKAGDVITAIDGKDIPPKTMANAITSTRGPVGSTVTLSILRDGRPQKITVTRGPGMTAQNGPGPNGPGPNGPGPGAGGSTYVHPQGLYHLQVPAGWSEKPGNDPNSVVWTHPKGGMVFVTIIPQAPMRSGEELFKNAVGPGLQQGGAQIIDGQNFPLPDGNQVFVANFRRQRNGVDELGQSACVISQGNGMIMQMMMPDAEKDALAPDLAQFGQTFNFGRPK